MDGPTEEDLLDAWRTEVSELAAEAWMNAGVARLMAQGHEEEAAVAHMEARFQERFEILAPMMAVEDD